MKRLITGFLLMAACGLTALPAVAEQSFMPCSLQAPCATPFEENGKWGVRNAKGEVTVPAIYSHAQFATERHPRSGAHGLIITRQDLGGIYKRLGLVDRNGVEITPPKYWEIWENKGVFTGGFDGKLCGIDGKGAEFIACGATHITRRDEWIEVTRNGEKTFLDFAGNEIEAPSREQQLAAAPKLAPGKPVALAAAPVPELERLVQERKWDEAVRLAAVSNEPRDIRDVLLIFNRSASTRDARYQAGKVAIYENIGMIQKATWVTGPLEKSELLKMETNIRTWFEGPVYAPPQGGGYINARTVGECHSMGGTVTVMRNCSR